MPENNLKWASCGTGNWLLASTGMPDGAMCEAQAIAQIKVITPARTAGVMSIFHCC